MSKINKGVMSSDKQDWETPWEFFNKIPYQFDLDACAYLENAKCSNFYTEEDNALIQEWKGTVWMNPPYGSALPTWLNKAYSESQKDYCDRVVCLVPARTDTAWFHDIACKGKILLLKGRINFLQEGKQIGSPAFPSMLVIYDKKIKPSIITWDWKSHV